MPHMLASREKTVARVPCRARACQREGINVSSRETASFRNFVMRPGRKRTPKYPSSEPELRTGSAAPDAAPSSIEASIGAEVRRLRKSLDLTVAALAAAAGVSTGMLSKIENGGISPSLATLDALAKALNVPMTQLFTDAEE